MTVDEGYVVKVCSALIRINSENPPGREAEAASYMAERLAELGLKAWVDRFGGSRGNAVGVLDSGEGLSLMLNTHLDTVPAGDKELWSVPPFSGELRDGKLYGRGAVDAKGCLAAMLGALKSLAEEGWPIRGRLVVAAVADEEADSEGTTRLVSQGHTADYAVVGEPTGLAPSTAHKGRLVLSVNFKGRSAHASAPQKGVNAAYAASQFALKVERSYAKRRRRHPLLGPPTASVTLIRGGVKDNVVPDSCEVVVDRRLLPGEELERVVRELSRAAEAVAEPRKAAAEVNVRRYVPPAETRAGSPIVEAAVRAVEEVLGRRVRPRGFRATCDMSILVNQAGIPTIILGPGSLERAHVADEWVGVEELVKAAEIYRRIVLGILGGRAGR